MIIIKLTKLKIFILFI